MGERLLKPVDIPLIITSSSSSPEGSRKTILAAPETGDIRKLSIDSRRKCFEMSPKSPTIQENRKHSVDKKGRNVGGSLKYEIGRNESVSNLIKLPAKWSSVRIKGTGFKDSRKSVVKIESCNGLPNAGIIKDYENLKSPISPNSNHIKPHIGNVSYVCDSTLLHSFSIHVKVYVTYNFSQLMLSSGDKWCILKRP